MALSKAIDTPILHARCLFSLGQVYQSERDDASASKYFEDAAKLFQQQKEYYELARSLEYLGDSLVNMDQLDKAEQILKSSLEIYIAGDHNMGQADAHSHLGTLYLDRGQFSDAEESMMRALEIYKQIPSLLGQAYATRDLSKLQISWTLGNLDKAEDFANQSLAFSKEANDPLAVENALEHLGQIYLQTDRIMDALQSFAKALTIFNHKMVLGQLSAVHYLGRAYIQLDQLSKAEALLVPYSKMEVDVYNMDLIFRALGWLYMCGDHLDTAEHYLNTALQLCRKFEDKCYVLAHLGVVYLKLDRLDDAEHALNSIQEFGGSWDVGMIYFWALGDLYTIKGQFDDAEHAFSSAMVYANYVRCSYQKGNIFRSLGTLQIKRGRVDRAIRAFKRACEFHRKAQWVFEQATDLERLGEAYEMLDRSEEAEAAFKEAAELMDSVREARQLSM